METQIDKLYTGVLNFSHILKIILPLAVDSHQCGHVRIFTDPNNHRVFSPSLDIH